MGALDLTIADPITLAGAPAGVVTFPAAAATGATIAILRTERYAVHGGVVFSTFGTVPSQLALVGNRIVRGNAAATPGTLYAIGIRCEALNGVEGQGVTLQLRAT